MATRFRKTKKVAPGVNLNINKGSMSVSVGQKGMKKTISTTGNNRTTIGIPGTGLSHSTTNSGKRGSEKAPASTNPKSWTVTLILSIILGFLGADRLYLGKIGTGLLKLVTIGGVGIWWIYDIVLTALGKTTDKNGNKIISSR